MYLALEPYSKTHLKLVSIKGIVWVVKVTVRLNDDNVIKCNLIWLTWIRWTWN